MPSLDQSAYDEKLRIEMLTVLETLSMGLLFVQPDFYATIGCAHMIERYGSIAKDIFVPANRSSFTGEYTSRIQSMLVEIVSIDMRVLRIKGNEALSLLVAILEYDCWDQCLDSEEGSYGLARLIFACHIGSSELATKYVPEITAALNSWLQPDETWSSSPPAEALCCAMFGPAWWQIREPLDTRSSSADQMLCNLITLERPAFKPGLVPWQDAHALALPELIGGPHAT